MVSARLAGVTHRKVIENKMPTLYSGKCWNVSSWLTLSSQCVNGPRHVAVQRSEAVRFRPRFRVRRLAAAGDIPRCDMFSLSSCLPNFLILLAGGLAPTFFPKFSIFLNNDKFIGQTGTNLYTYKFYFFT